MFDLYTNLKQPMAIVYFDQQVKSSLKNKRKLSTFLQSLMRRQLQMVKTLDLIYVFCDDAYLLEINKEYLNHDTLTDIITFDLSENPKTLQAEIYISTERVQENAAKFGVSYEHELHRVIFHGALHLCGFKDKKPEDQKRMREEEDLCLHQYFEN
jgi:rRNA maturation RNase YbeY